VSSTPAIAGARGGSVLTTAGARRLHLGHRDCVWVSSAPSHGDVVLESSAPATATARGRAPPATVTGALLVLLPA
jgi:hypothetical protein